MDVVHQFIDCLVEEVVDKLRELAHNVQGSQHLLVHLVDETIAFEKVQVTFRRALHAPHFLPHTPPSNSVL